MKRRTFNAFSLSFLDVMFCGFGAVILFFMIINADTQARRQDLHDTSRNEADRLQTEVLEAERHAAQTRNTLQDLDDTLVQTRGRTVQVIETIDTRMSSLHDCRKKPWPGCSISRPSRPT